MAEKPTTLPQWSTTGGTTLDPGSAKKASGWTVDEKPPARWWNWLLNLIYQWIQYLDTPVGTGAGAGIAATGGSTDGAGLKGTGGATNGNGVEGVSVGTGSGVKGTGLVGGKGVHGVGTGASVNAGVYGENAAINGVGVYGIATGTSGAKGVFGIADTSGGVGVRANCGDGFAAFYAGGGTGHAMYLEGDTTSPAVAAMRWVPQDAQPTGPNAVGDMYVTTAGVLKICTVAGSPGTWVSVGAQT